MQDRYVQQGEKAEAWATCFAQVAIEPTLLYENSYEPIPGYIPKAPTATQVPTEIRGAVAMTIFNAGQSPIEVGVLSAKMPLVVKLQNRLSGFAVCLSQIDAITQALHSTVT